MFEISCICWLLRLYTDNNDDDVVMMLWLAFSGKDHVMLLLGAPIGLDFLNVSSSSDSGVTMGGHSVMCPLPIRKVKIFIIESLSCKVATINSGGLHFVHFRMIVPSPVTELWLCH